MPQSERSQIIKQLLRWLEAKGKTGGANISECLHQIQVEITEMGATQRRAEQYLRSCEKTGLIYTQGLRFKLTKKGENWLKRKVP